MFLVFFSQFFMEKSCAVCFLVEIKFKGLTRQNLEFLNEMDRKENKTDGKCVYF